MSPFARLKTQCYTAPVFVIGGKMRSLKSGRLALAFFAFLVYAAAGPSNEAVAKEVRILGTTSDQITGQLNFVIEVDGADRIQKLHIDQPAYKPPKVTFDVTDFANGLTVFDYAGWGQKHKVTQIRAAGFDPNKGGPVQFVALRNWHWNSKDDEFVVLNMQLVHDANGWTLVTGPELGSKPFNGMYLKSSKALLGMAPGGVEKISLYQLEKSNKPFVTLDTKNMKKIPSFFHQDPMILKPAVFSEDPIN